MRKNQFFMGAAAMLFALGMTAGLQSCTTNDNAAEEIDKAIEEEQQRLEEERQAELACNLLNAAKVDVSFYYANSDWSGRETPENTVEDGKITATYTESTAAQWQNQIRLTTDIAVNADTKYTFTATVKSSNAIGNAIIKGEKGDAALFEVDYPLAAGEEYVAVARNIAGKDIENLEIVFDFGGSPANTTIEISNVILKESDCGKTIAQGDNELIISLDGKELADGTYQGSLEQGKAYSIKASAKKGDIDLFAAPFFEKNADGTFTFVALTGNYSLSVNATSKVVKVYPVNAEGAAATIADGGLWIIGQGIGFPSTGSEPGWNTGANTDIAVPQVKKDVYQLTVVAGEQIGTTWHNFKFFGQANWGIEFVSSGDYAITAKNDYIGIGDGHNVYDFDNGNTFVAKAMEEGKTYVITIDFTKGLNAGELYVEEAK